MHALHRFHRKGRASSGTFLCLKQASRSSRQQATPRPASFSAHTAQVTVPPARERRVLEEPLPPAAHLGRVGLKPRLTFYSNNNAPGGDKQGEKQHRGEEGGYWKLRGEGNAAGTRRRGHRGSRRDAPAKPRSSESPARPAPGTGVSCLVSAHLLLPPGGRWAQSRLPPARVAGAGCVPVRGPWLPARSSPRRPPVGGAPLALARLPERRGCSVDACEANGRTDASCGPSEDGSAASGPASEARSSPGAGKVKPVRPQALFWV